MLHREKTILPQLQAGNNSTRVDVLNGISRISKEEFVEYAKGSFRLVYVLGLWFVGCK